MPLSAWCVPRVCPNCDRARRRRRPDKTDFVMATLSPDAQRRLLSAVREKVAAFGNDDDVLPEYIMVMLHNGKRKEQIATELEAFLGHEANRLQTGFGVP